MAGIRFDSVGKVYDDGTRALKDLSLEVADGEFMVMVGPSGCGKTTAMRLVAGLERITEGNIWIGSTVVNSLTPKERNIAMVFQNYALYPQMSAFDNIAFPLTVEKRPKAEIRQAVGGLGRTLDLEGLLERRPGRLSGGQRQRVAMGRAIVRNPQVFLMDEPLSNLDAKLRVQMRAEVLRVHRELGVTTIYVTHDQVEAMTMGDRVAVMKGGVLQQVDTGQTLYDAPANLFVATFIGSPEMNVLVAEVDGRLLRLAGGQVELSDDLLSRFPGLKAYGGHAVAAGVRPERVHEVRPGDGAGGDCSVRVRGVVQLVENLGPECLIHLAVPALDSSRPSPSPNGDVGALGESGAVRENGVLVARLFSHARVKAGEPMELDIDISKAHFFDIESGKSLLEEAYRGQEQR